jgi:hypothetical protein
MFKLYYSSNNFLISVIFSELLLKWVRILKYHLLSTALPFPMRTRRGNQCKGGVLWGRACCGRACNGPRLIEN